MQIQLISHASVITKHSETQIWSDPWLISKVFNNSWSLFPKPFFENEMFEKINYIWISHEHPDHFNIPTLRSFPNSFKEKVTILFQKKNSEKIFNTLRNIGFKNLKYLPNRTIIELNPHLRIYCYQTHIIDSCLAILDRDKVILNVNDAELDSKDCKVILKDLGYTSIDVVLNQFSLAGYLGHLEREKYLPKFAKEKLIRIEKNHRDLRANITIPFASFVYFSCKDNRYMNQYANRPKDVFQHFKKNKLNCIILYPGDTYDVNKSHNSLETLKKYDLLYQKFLNLEYDDPQSVPIDEIKHAFSYFAKNIHDKYPKILIYLLKPLKFYIDDLKKAIEVSIYSKKFREISLSKESGNIDIIVNSQPLYFAFKYPFGCETLSVSARFSVISNYENWRKIKILSILNNAEIYFKPKYLFNRRNFKYMKNRIFNGLSRQIIQRLRRVKAI